MSYKINDVFRQIFTTNNSGVAFNADILPWATFARNGLDDFSVKTYVTNMDTGRYSVSGTIPSAYLVGDSIGVTISGVVSSTLFKAYLSLGAVDTLRLNDVVTNSLVNSNVVSISGMPVAAPNSSGAILSDLRYINGTLAVVYNGIARSGAPGWIQLANTETSTDQFYQYQYINLVGGNGAGQLAIVTAYSGITKTAYIQTPFAGGNWLVTPYNDTQYSFIGLSTVAVEFMQNQLVSSGAGVNFNNFFNDNGAQSTVTLDNIAVSSSGTTDWTTTERSQIRYRIGLDGTAATPATAQPAFTTSVTGTAPSLFIVPGSVANAVRVSVTGTPQVNVVSINPGLTVSVTGTISNVTLGASGFESIVIENGVNARQLLSIMGAAIAGSSVIAGNNITYYAINNNATARILSTAISGSRNSIILTLP